MKALRNCAIAICAMSPAVLSAQNSVNRVDQKEVTQEKTQSFDTYCKENAIDFITVSPEKLANLKVTGEVKQVSMVKPTYLDYGIVLKENETQYFKVADTDKVIAAKSLFVLRLNYANSQKK